MGAGEDEVKVMRAARRRAWTCMVSSLVNAAVWM
jgi:hypothetical protein